MPLEDLNLPEIWAEQRAWQEERQKQFKAVEPVIQQTMLQILTDNPAGLKMTQLVDQTSQDMASNPSVKENTDFYESDIVKVFQYFLFTGRIVERDSYVVTLPQKKAVQK